MHTTARSILAFGLGTLFSLSLALPTSGQLGHVVKAQKISDTSGGFTAELDDQDQFGRSIVNLGDLDGDGVTDLLVGAHTDDDGVLYGLDRGSVYILFLYPNGFVKSWQKISDLSGNFSGHLDPSDQFGRAAACLGDLDGDGVVDVAVSSNYDDDGGTNRGAIYILFLNTNGTVKSTQKISSTQGGLPNVLKMHDEFGRSIVNLGDMDGDGVTDIAVGTPEDDDGGTNTGALHVLFLNTNGTVKSYRRISRSTDGLRLRPGDWFGHCMANLGDFNHDGVTDIVVGSVLDDDGGVNQGSIWILYLNANGSVKESHEINELVGGFTAQLDDIDQFGTSVVSLGDLDGDGVTDIAVGAVKDDDGGPLGDPDADVGTTYVLFLKPDATVKSWVKISDTSGDLPYGLVEGDWFGCALGKLGGSPLDGLFNVAIGGRYDNDGGGNHGSIYLVQLNDGTAPVAEFVADRTLGVAPMTVTFTDTSAGEVTSRLWNFSNPPQSTQTNPTKTFTTPGTYDIQLTAKGPKGTDVLAKHGYITVSAGPLADFDAAPTSGIAPLAVAFTDRSEGTVASRTWDFGDGTTSSETSPTHTYAAEGTYTVSLTCIGPNGTHTKTRAGLISIEGSAPAAAFAASVTTGFASLSVQFDDQSTGLFETWSWNFGDGTTSSAPSPTHVFTAPGTYDVTLTVAGAHGSDVEQRSGFVVVESPVPAAAFSAQPTSGYAPLGVQFSDQSTGHVTAWTWNFGDGSSADHQPDPVHVFDVAGTYTVSLSVAGPDGSDVATHVGEIVVAEPPPVAEFHSGSSAGFAPLTIEFTDQSSGTITSWLWTFGDGFLSSLPNPSHAYANPGSYDVSLRVRGPSGIDTELKPGWITVQSPALAAEFGASATSGNWPLTVAFTDLSSGLVTGRLWNFGDGTSSTAVDPEHVYGAAGDYTVTLTLTGPSGTDVESKLAYVHVLEPAPHAAFAPGQTSGLVPLSVSFTDQSSGSIATRLWTFGDGTTSTAKDPVHVYSTPGSYSVTLAVSGPGGADSLTKPNVITVALPPPVAEFTAGPWTGFVPLSVAFADLSTGSITSWTWNFGDRTNARTRNPVKTYTRAGSFTVTLTVKGPGGTSTVSRGPVFAQLLPMLADGGFELQTAGGAPASPWSVSAGSAHVIRSSATVESGMPAEGTRWCELSAAGSSLATPPSVPWGAGSGPVGAAGIERAFAFQPLAPHLLFDAAFVLGDLEDSALTNDFMSVDVTDGVTTWNLFHADTFSAFPNASALHALPMTAVQRVHVDLRTLFPAATGATVLTLRAAVGNAGDGLDASYGYLDSVRLVPAATAAFRNGTGRNAARYTSSPAVPGGNWTIQVDTTGHVGARQIQLIGMARPAAGTLRAAGEVLTAGTKLFTKSWPATIGLNVRTIALPVDLALLGQFMSTQVTITGGVTELCNAYDLTLGF